MKKQILLIFFLIFSFSLICGCVSPSTTEEKETKHTAGTEINSRDLFAYSEMLNHTDEDVVAMLGKGEPSYQDEGNTLISTRLYQSNLLGFGGEAVLIYNEGEEPAVNEVLVTFNNGKYNEIMDALSQQLGDAVLADKRGTANADAKWQQNNVVYSLTSYEGNIMLGIWNDYGTPKE